VPKDVDGSSDGSTRHIELEGILLDEANREVRKQAIMDKKKSELEDPEATAAASSSGQKQIIAGKTGESSRSSELAASPAKRKQSKGTSLAELEDTEPQPPGYETTPLTPTRSDDYPEAEGNHAKQDVVSPELSAVDGEAAAGVISPLHTSKESSEASEELRRLREEREDLAGRIKVAEERARMDYYCCDISCII